VFRDGRFNRVYPTEVFIMGFFSDLFYGAANAAVNSAVRNAGVRHIENLSAQLGWNIDGRAGDTGMVFHFKDPLFGIRQVLVTVGSKGEIGMISSQSNAQIPANSAPGKLAYYLLAENSKSGLYAWNMSENDNGTVTFSLACTTLVLALTADLFRHICASMATDVSNLDAKLRQAGVI
jgi:hypothetical protein